MTGQGASHDYETDGTTKGVCTLCGKGPHGHATPGRVVSCTDDAPCATRLAPDGQGVYGKTHAAPCEASCGHEFLTPCCVGCEEHLTAVTGIPVRGPAEGRATWVWTNLRCPSCAHQLKKDRGSAGTFRCWKCGDTWTRTERTDA